ncbi:MULTISPECIES: endo alpha-1,4 polygalactosaminidase [Vibrio]|uniref:endo alpha-1,4 polygalactosaminidase n=1 Tax=Vibrio TaxID=662 RepID=UPI001CDBBC6C|nr:MULTISPECIES: endo alpha-1,4 polygalactosaminidase [Vibrio]MCA2418850.1 endo alpha-1,4 polygalactosaminidase [Vibrio alginolyticus]MCA2443476.1 endo alpha-1,4 polygalactosaminidase [Vibrio alginolyticus]MDW1948093.1 endo alpha-1,4 polygalactosaminidase [Vibrio sp. 812(2023)]MDW1990892.1 endo alpha-1,4 polygalactosaminidase [Vibrio sp. 780]MDW2103018.1 endo alpha-1,4 polygalactosaminidase [Vibrio sp. 1580]
MEKLKSTQSGNNKNKFTKLCVAAIAPFYLLANPGISIAATDNLLAVNDYVEITEITATTINVLVNDTYATKPNITVTKPSRGKVRIKNNGKIRYIPNGKFETTDSFTYTISDGVNSSTATVNISLVSDEIIIENGTDNTSDGTESTDNPGTDNTTDNTGSTDNTGTSSDRWIPAPGTTWSWQLENYSNVTIDPEVEVYGVDLFDGIDEGVISNLKNQGKKIICYFSAGTREDWRPDAGDFSTDSVIANGEMQDWAGEVWLDISNQTALNNSIKPIMTARLELAAQNGCDGVEPDNVDAFENTEETQGYISSADQLSYNKWLATTAHEKGLSIGLKNDIGQTDELVDYFDYAINEQCFAYGNECTTYEENFLKQNKAVFNQEYYTRGRGGEIDEYTFQYSACPYFTEVKISSNWKVGYALDGKDVVRCE